MHQAAGTLGRILIEGADEVKLFGEAVEVRAKITQLPGLSGHADKGGLIEWVNAFSEKPDKVFITHGEDTACTLFAECLRTEHGHDAYAPYSGTRVDLITGAVEFEASRQGRGSSQSSTRTRAGRTRIWRNLQTRSIR